ncbi:MAG: hypothetical protein WDA21_00085 [Bacilli bacterium]
MANTNKRYKGVNIDYAFRNNLHNITLEERLKRKPQLHSEDTLYLCYVDGIKKREVENIKGKQLSEKDLQYLDFAREYVINYEEKNGMVSIPGLKQRLYDITYKKQFPEYFSEDELIELDVEIREIRKKLKQIMLNEKGGIKNDKHQRR